MVVAPAAPKLSLQCEAIAADTTTIRSPRLGPQPLRHRIRPAQRHHLQRLPGSGRTHRPDRHQPTPSSATPGSPLLKEQIDPTAIDVLIVSHTEPDHSGLIGDLIDLNPEIEIVGSKGGAAVPQGPGAPTVQIPCGEVRRGVGSRHQSRERHPAPLRIPQCSKPALAGHDLFLRSRHGDPLHLRCLRPALLL